MNTKSYFMKRMGTTPGMLLLIFISLFSSVKAQNISVTATAGNANASYATLKAVFDAINAGTHRGTITALVLSSTSESATASLNASGSGSANYASLSIQASGGATSTISGSIDAAALVELNGADNVTIDGINSGGNFLTISNTSTSATAGTSTIKFLNDATLNSITNCSLQGSSTASVSGGVNGGTIWFSTATTNGNDNNSVSNCDIGPAGSNLPSRAVWANGSTSTAAILNSTVTISNCNIFDFFSATAASRGIEIVSGNSDWNISSNKFYQTATRTQTSGALHSPIRISTTSFFTGNNFQITNNIIGYSSSSGTGTYTLNGSSNSFVAINLAAVGLTGATSVQGNTITAISQTTSLAGSGSSSSCAMLLVSTGLVSIGHINGNTFGGTGGFSFTSTSVSTSDMIVMGNFSASNINFSGNSINNITLNSSTGGIAFYGVYINTNSSCISTLSNNTLGSTSSNSIINSANFGSSRIVGINNQAARCIISGNVIRNFTLGAPNGGTGQSASVIGISVIASSDLAAGHAVSGNLIHSLSNTNGSAITAVSGIHYNGPSSGTNSIYGNFVHSLSVSANDGDIRGISAHAGASSYYNNMVRLGINATGSTVNGKCAITGMYDVSGSNNFYFNTVCIVGTSNDTLPTGSFAFRSDVTNNTRAIKNNIFYNSRQSTQTLVSYAIKLAGSSANPAGLTIDNNNYFTVTNNGTVALAFYNGSAVSTLAALKIAIGQNTSSINVDPLLNNIAGTALSVNLHVNSGSGAAFLESAGAVISGISFDYDNDARPGPSGSVNGGGSSPDIGADEFDGVLPCSGTPTGGTALAANQTLCSGNSTNLTLSGATSIGGVTYQWKTAATVGGSYTNVVDGSGSGSNAYTTGAIAGSVYYLCSITCPYSGLSANSSAVNVSLAHTWTGSLSTNWATGGNWTCASMPASTNNAVISTSAVRMPSLSASSSITNLTLEAGTVLTLNDQTLTLNGAVGGGGKLAGSNASALTITGNSGSVLFDQSSSSTASLNNLNINGSASASLGSAVNIYGTVTIAGTLDLNGQNLVLKSTASGTARIAHVTGTLSNASNVSVERYIQGGYRRTRFLSCPVQGKTLENWRGYFHVTGPDAVSPAGSLGSVNGNGYDWTFNNSPSVFKYNETTNGTAASGWTGCSGAITNYLLDKGAGYRVLIRGDRNIGNALLDGTSSPVRNPFTISLTGAIYTGSFTLNNASSPFAITYSDGGSGAANDGWNLVGNPYPSQISWDNIHDAARNGSGPYSGTYISNISQTIYVFNPVSNSYLSYNAIANSGSLTSGIIESGQAFFIKADAAAPSLTFNESAKSAGSAVGSTLKTSPNINELAIKLQQDTSNYDHFILKVLDGTSKKADPYDIFKIDNPEVNLSSLDEDGTKHSLSCIPQLQQDEVIGLYVDYSNTGKLSFSFSNLINFSAAKEIWLMDTYLNKQVLLKEELIYDFEITSDMASKGGNRFSLLLKHTQTNLPESMNPTSPIQIFPNPVSHVLNLVYQPFESDDPATWHIYNSMGALMLQGIIDDQQTKIGVAQLPGGIYYIEIKDAMGMLVKKFIK